MFQKAGTLFVVLIIAAVMTGCGGNKGQDTSTEPANDLTIVAGLPNDYPHDIFPIYPGSKISQAMDSAGSYTIVAVTDAHHSDVIAFYKNVLKDATKMSETETETSLTSFGMISGYTYNLDAALSDEYTGYNSQIWIILTK